MVGAAHRCAERDKKELGLPNRIVTDEDVRLAGVVADPRDPRFRRGDSNNVVTIRSAFPDAPTVLSANEELNENQITAAEVIERVFQSHLVGENQARDWKEILLKLRKDDHVRHQCEQEGSVRNIARKLNLSRATVRKRVMTQLMAIESGVRAHMPASNFIADDRTIWGQIAA
jgi:ribosomal protein S14